MAFFRATVKKQMQKGVRLEKGMSVDFPSRYGSSLGTNGGHEVIDAFIRKYGLKIRMLAINR